MPIPANQIVAAQINIKATLAAGGGSAKPVQTIFCYRRTATVIVPTKLALANIFEANVFSVMLLAFNQAYTAATANIRWLNDATDPPIPFTYAGVGARVADRLPSYNAVFMNLITALRGGHYRGSKHFPAASEEDTTGDILTGAGLTRWQAVQTALLLQLTDADGNVWNPCVLAGVPLSQIRTNPTTVVTNDITTITLDKTLGTMRRRKVRTVI